VPQPIRGTTHGTIPDVVSTTKVPGRVGGHCGTTVSVLERVRDETIVTPMPNDSDPESIAELLQALDDVREAARRVDRERNLAVERPEPAGGASEPPPPHTAAGEFPAGTRTSGALKPTSRRSAPGPGAAPAD
jgi:hypothetical protein